LKTAIVILSDPCGGSEEAFGRVVNAMAAAYDFQKDGGEVTVLFQGAGSRWPAELDRPDHPGHQLYVAVRERVAGISCGCADVFGAETTGYDRLTESMVPGTTGFPSLRRLTAEGYSVLVF
jgi:hypothetical protein